jgi:hypothetical protein
VDLAQKNVAARDESSSLPSAGSDGAAQGAAPALGAPGFEAISGAPAPARADVQEQVLPATGSGDLLEGMSDEDKWGIKGLKTLLANYPDYNTLILGIDPAELGLDLNSTECDRHGRNEVARRANDSLASSPPSSGRSLIPSRLDRRRCGSVCRSVIASTMLPRYTQRSRALRTRPCFTSSMAAPATFDSIGRPLSCQ